VVLGVEVEDASGSPVSFDARIEISHDYLRPLVDTVPGRAEIRVTPGPIDMQMLPICQYGFDPDRQLVITEDTTLQYRLPELVDVTVQTLDQQGVPASYVFVLRGMTTLQTDAGPESVPFSRQEDPCTVNLPRTDTQGLATVAIPVADVARVWMTSGLVYGEATGAASGLELVGGETVVVQEGRFTRGNDDGLLARRR
jgi:hypothetical protein